MEIWKKMWVGVFFLNTVYIKDIELLERVQHRFTRLFSELRSLPYDMMIDFVSLVFGLFRNVATELISLNFQIAF